METMNAMHVHKESDAVYYKSSLLDFKKRSENSDTNPQINWLQLSDSSSYNDFDKIRLANAVYEYLCRLEEARLWMQDCIQECLPQSTELELRLRNGVYLAKLGNFIAPHVVPLKRIFDSDQKVYNASGLHYRHTDNINYWVLAMKAIGLPSYFYPNSFDVYGKKNMPKAIYCVHALNLYLYRCGKSIRIIDLIGKIQFTTEEIKSVSMEFQKYGIQLPAFCKIGGILAHEVTSNDAPLHAAIIAINIAICQQNHELLLAALMNPNAKLHYIFKENAKTYQKVLLELKSKKTVDIKNRCKKINELCWDFLTHEIVQEGINSANVMIALSKLRDSVLTGKVKNFMAVLKDPVLNISDIVEENSDAYITVIKEATNFNNSEFFHISEIQSLITTTNYNVFKCQEINSALTNFNNILASGDYCASYNMLKSLVSEVSLHDLGKQFYHLQLNKQKNVKGTDLNLQDIQEYLPKLSALLDVSIAVIQNNVEETYRALSNSVIKCWELNVNLKNEYFNTLKEIKEKKLDFPLPIEIINNCITDINDTYKLKECSAVCIKSINCALTQSNESLLINLLLEDPCILCVDPKHRSLYLNLFQDYKLKHPECDILSHDEIQNQINIANKLASDAKYYCACLASINIAVDKRDFDILFNSLKILPGCETLCFGCKKKYLTQLIEVKTRINENQVSDKDSSCFSWIKWDVNSQSTFYLNLKTLETTWNLEESFASLYLCKEHIIEAINVVQNECQCFNYKVLENFINSLQSRIRGFLVRQNISYKTMPPMNYSSNHILAAVKLQSFVRMSFVRKKFLKQKAEKFRLQAAARVIQRHWRAFKVNQNLNILAHSSNPPLSLMQKIIYMLEISNDDYSEEFQLHTLKGKAVQSIRYNQSLLREIDEIDVKIGLLIRNRITLEDLLKQKKNSRKIDSLEYERNDSLFRKRYNSLIESFENLLYLLQTKPVYLARLIILLPSNQATSLIESVIFSLYNFGSTPREEYLLLKMLSLTLEEDIKHKGDNLSDIIKGENIIMKIIISFYRKNYWRDSLKILLQPLVLEVLNDKTNLCNLDPVEIYKVWQNELETQTGKKSSMPYEITVEDALCHTEVNIRLNLYMDNLLQYSLRFCEVILNNQSLIPYGMMYISKILKVSLQKKYPTSSNEELLKIVGNFLYYRYLNPAIIAPDVFDIITTQCNEQLADYERLKLSAIAKFLHFSVTGKKYTEETDYLMCLNPYISDCHEKLMAFFEDVCRVQSLEKYFNIDIFSEAIVNIPEVYMSMNELQTLYKLIREREYDLSLESNDTLHTIIENFDPNLFEEICSADTSNNFLNTEVCLSLKNKYDLEVEDETEEEQKIYAETKFMVITLLQVFLDVNNVTDLYRKEPVVEEGIQFEKMCFTKRGEIDLSLNWIKMSHNWKTLPILQSALEVNLNFLESAGYVTGSNNYQEILNDIAKDIVNRWRYRTNRKNDIQKLREIQKQLDIKTVYYLEKLDYYYKYIAACLENMKIGKQNSRLFSFRQSTSNELKYKKTIKCSGNKLHEKGILLAIKDLDICQFKNIMFEISPSEDLGIFTINTKFMGISLENVNIDIQELLNRQYQGIAELNMFEHVTVNNNLLLHFLNSKFYGKNTT